MHPASPTAPGPIATEDAPCGVWQPPAYQVISLSCEISAYAPDDQPLF